MDTTTATQPLSLRKLGSSFTVSIDSETLERLKLRYGVSDPSALINRAISESLGLRDFILLRKSTVRELTKRYSSEHEVRNENEVVQMFERTTCLSHRHVVVWLDDADLEALRLRAAEMNEPIADTLRNCVRFSVEYAPGYTNYTQYISLSPTQMKNLREAMGLGANETLSVNALIGKLSKASK